MLVVRPDWKVRNPMLPAILRTTPDSEPTSRNAAREIVVRPPRSNAGRATRCPDECA